MNFIIAERDPHAKSTDSRNARGKSSILQAINFCLGGNRPVVFKGLAEAGWTFTLELDLFGGIVSATRSLKSGSRVVVEARGKAQDFLRDYQREDGSVSLAEWKYLLGLGLFSLDELPDAGDRGLSARTLLSYVVRLDAPKDPTKILAQQPAWSSRQHVAFLLGLDWRYTQQLAEMDKQESTFDALEYASESKLVPGLIPDEADLLLQREEVRREVEATVSAASAFVILEDPEGALNEVDELAAILTKTADEQVVARRLLDLYRSSIRDDPNDAESPQIGAVYDELGLVFEERALRRFSEVEAFHEEIVGSRRRFLEDEIARLEAEVAGREPVIGELNSRRQGLLRQLASGGGIDDLLLLQTRVADAQARLAAIDNAIEVVRGLSVSREELSVRQATTRRDARENLNTNRAFTDGLNARFSEVIRELYDRSASITVDVDDLGYKFSIKVSGSSSSGITRMQLFGFDLTLMEQSPERRHPHFLLHDSVVFDGVDPRQVERALGLARATVERGDYQYVVTMNSNDVPPGVAAEEWFESAKRRVILDTETGGAFGVVF